MPYKDPEKAREDARERARKYRAAHPEKVQEAQRKYHASMSEEAKARKRERDQRYRDANREQVRTWNREWYRRNPRSLEQNQTMHWRARYGLTPERWTSMLAEQDGCCYLCGEPLDLGATRKIHVDHDHSCCRGNRSCGRCVRGLACEECNHGIGQFGDDPERMRRVADALTAAIERLATEREAWPVQEELPMNVALLRRKEEGA